MRTTAWQAQKSLRDLIETLPVVIGPPSVPVYLGGVIGEPPVEFVAVAGEIDNGDQEYAASGLAAKDETYELRVDVFTSFATVDYEMVADRLKAIGDEIEDAINEDPTLAGTVMLAQVARFRVEESVFDANRQGLLTLWVRCSGWLT